MSTFFDFSSELGRPSPAKQQHHQQQQAAMHHLDDSHDERVGDLANDSQEEQFQQHHQQHQPAGRALLADLTNNSNRGVGSPDGVDLDALLRKGGAHNMSPQQQQHQQLQSSYLPAQNAYHRTPAKNANDSSNDESPGARIMRGVLDTIEDTPEGKREMLRQQAEQARRQLLVPPPPQPSNNSNNANMNMTHHHGDHQNHRYVNGTSVFAPPHSMSNNNGNGNNNHARSGSTALSSQVGSSQCSSRSTSPPQPNLVPPRSQQQQQQQQQHQHQHQSTGGGRPTGIMPVASSTSGSNGVNFSQFNPNPNSSRFPNSRAVNGFSVSTTTATGATRSPTNASLPAPNSVRFGEQQQSGGQQPVPIVAGQQNTVTRMLHPHDFTLQLVLEFKLERRIRVRATPDFQPAQGSYVIVELDHGLGIDCGVCIGVFPYELRHTIPRAWEAGSHATGRALRLASPADCEVINAELPRVEAEAIERAHSLVKFLHFPFDIIDAECQFDNSTIKIFYSVLAVQRGTQTVVPNLSRIQRELSFHLNVRRVFFEQLVDLDDPDLVIKKRGEQHQQQQQQHSSPSGYNSTTDNSNNSSVDGISMQ